MAEAVSLTDRRRQRSFGDAPQPLSNSCAVQTYLTPRVVGCTELVEVPCAFVLICRRIRNRCTDDVPAGRLSHMCALHPYIYQSRPRGSSYRARREVRRSNAIVCTGIAHSSGSEFEHGETEKFIAHGYLESSARLCKAIGH